jgi:hypothetical protein
MYQSTIQKLKIKENLRGKVVNLPQNLDCFERFLADSGYLSEDSSDYDFLICFVKSAEDVANTVPLIYDLKFDGLLWMLYPKKTASSACSISRDNGWEPLLEAGYKGVAMVAFDSTWSAFRFRSSSLIKSSKR